MGIMPPAAEVEASTCAAPQAQAAGVGGPSPRLRTRRGAWPPLGQSRRPSRSSSGAMEAEGRPLAGFLALLGRPREGRPEPFFRLDLVATALMSLLGCACGYLTPAETSGSAPIGPAFQRPAECEPRPSLTHARRALSLGSQKGWSLCHLILSPVFAMLLLKKQRLR
jgi:hypothetical protein